jgi:hypothetical protein
MDADEDPQTPDTPDDDAWNGPDALEGEEGSEDWEQDEESPEPPLSREEIDALVERVLDEELARLKEESSEPQAT